MFCSCILYLFAARIVDVLAEILVNQKEILERIKALENMMTHVPTGGEVCDNEFPIISNADDLQAIKAGCADPSYRKKLVRCFRTGASVHNNLNYRVSQKSPNDFEDA
jgi:hypothetical protein